MALTSREAKPRQPEAKPKQPEAKPAKPRETVKPTAGKPSGGKLPTAKPSNPAKPFVVKDGKVVANPGYKPTGRAGATPAPAPKPKPKLPDIIGPQPRPGGPQNSSAKPQLPRPTLQPTPLPGLATGGLRPVLPTGSGGAVPVGRPGAGPGLGQSVVAGAEAVGSLLGKAALGAASLLFLTGDSPRPTPSGMPAHPQQPKSNVTATPKNTYPGGFGVSYTPKAPKVDGTPSAMPITTEPKFGVRPIPLESEFPNMSTINLMGKGGRQANRLNPDARAVNPDGEGVLHTTYKRDPVTGKIYGYVEWSPNEKNPTGFDAEKRLDATGGSHTNSVTLVDVPTPHVHGKDIVGGVRPALPEEIPK